MSIKLNIQRKASHTSEKVKSTDIHPTEPWFLTSLFHGAIQIWNYNNNTNIKTLNVSTAPVRSAKFVPRKCWIVACCDDLCIHVFNYNTLGKVTSFPAHGDFIRTVVIHPVKPFVLSCADDFLIKLWDWENNWNCVRTFTGHSHYIMCLVINPKDLNIFASGSMDTTVKFWQLGSSQANSTINAHTNGTNAVDYSPVLDKPYIVSGGDDGLVKLWDYHTKACLQVLQGHHDNVVSIKFHLNLPLIFSGSEDGTIMIWNSNSFKIEDTLVYNMGRVWSLSVTKGGNYLAFGSDRGSMLLDLGDESPKITMDGSGKILMGRSSLILQSNTKLILDTASKDGEKANMNFKELGTCDILPSKLIHSPNGRFVAITSGSEYIVYTAVALRSKCYGKASSFTWSADSNMFAVIDNSSLQCFKSFKAQKSIKISYTVQDLFGGSLLGAQTKKDIYFYDWETLAMIHRIDTYCSVLYWNSSGSMCALCAENSTFILKCNTETINDAIVGMNTRGAGNLVNGVDDAFSLAYNLEAIVTSGVWAGDCFLFVTKNLKLCYSVGSDITIIAHLSEQSYILNFVVLENKIYLIDKDYDIFSHTLETSLLNLQQLMLNNSPNSNIMAAIRNVPESHKYKAAQLLESQGLLNEAYSITNELQHKFSLAMQLNLFDEAFNIAEEIGEKYNWEFIAKALLKSGNIKLAQKALQFSGDYESLLLLCYCIRDAGTIRKLALKTKEEKLYNISFIAYYIVGNYSECIEILGLSQKHAEATLMSYSYEPSSIEGCLQEWKTKVSKMNEKSANRLASPKEYPELFPKLKSE